MKYPRTINIVESWHRAFNNDIKHAHPNLVKFIQCIQREEEKTRIQLLRWENGVVELSRANLIREEKLFIITRNFKFYSIENYFAAISSSYKWKHDSY